MGAARIHVVNAIDLAENDYRSLWSTLEYLRSGNITGARTKDFLEFQTILAGRLFSLDESYRDIIKVRRELIGRKQALNPTWFRSRMRKTQKYIDAIRETITIGTNLGDAFAWFFYQHADDVLEHHSTKQSQRLRPHGEGGAGELAFVKNYRQFNGQFILYHGITSILRVGDISLINLKNLSVVGLGELKSVRHSEDIISIKMLAIGGKEVVPSKAEPTISSDKLRENIPDYIVAKLRRQSKEMKTALTPSPSNRSSSLDSSPQVHILEELLNELKTKRVSTKVVGQGLLLIGVKPRAGRLSSLLLPRSAMSWDSDLISVKTTIMSIMDKDQVERDDNANALLSGTLEPIFLLGHTPLFWWPISEESRRSLYFSERGVIQYYNPAHLAVKLRNIGFEAKLGTNGFLQVSKQLQSGTINIHGIEFFYASIIQFLMQEDYVVEVIRQTAESTTSPISDVELKMGIRISQRFAARE